MIIAIEGPLTFDTVAHWQREVFAAIESASGEFILEFQAVTAVNSAALALMLEVLRRARARQLSLKFSHIPEKLASLAKVSSLETLFAISSAV